MRAYRDCDRLTVRITRPEGRSLCDLFRINIATFQITTNSNRFAITYSALFLFYNSTINE
nr:MAG TPA: hypothetical protein [Caudoviricetes sp.]